MHRSGTSLCARILGALGVDIAEEPGPGPGNEEGHWERWELVGLHNRILTALNRRYGDIGEYMPLHDLALPADWVDLPTVRSSSLEIEDFLGARIRADTIFGFKDPRVSRLMPMWNQILERNGLGAKFIFCLRNPNEVAASLWKRDRIPHAVGLYRWLVHTCEFIANLGSQSLLVNYQDWFDAPNETAKRLADFAGLDLAEGSVTKMIGVVNGRQRHNVSPPPSTASFVGRVYHLLNRRSFGPQDLQEAKTLSREFVAFSESVPFEFALSHLQEDARSNAILIERLQADAVSNARLLSDKERLVLELGRSDIQREDTLEGLPRSVAEKEELLGSLRQLIVSRDESLGSLRQVLTELRGQLLVRDGSLEGLQRLLAERDKTLNGLKELLAERDVSLTDLQRSLREREDAVTALQRSVTSREQTLGVLQERFTQALLEQSGRPLGSLIDWFRVSRDYPLVRKSGLFDDDWYRHRYPTSSLHPGRRLVFFLSRGWLAGQNPNRLFDTEWYLQQYPDVRQTHINPVVHFLYRGAQEGRNPGPTFNTANYLRDHPELNGGDINPLSHYLRAERTAARLTADISISSSSNTSGANDQVQQKSADRA